MNEMISKEIMGVILAGGKGSRMYPFSEHYPKCILPICNKPIMEYQIEMMRDMGITEIIVVIGHYGFDVVRNIGSGERFGIKIVYVDQGETLGIAHALGKLERHIDRPFLLFLGDIFFVTGSLEPMLEEFLKNGADAVLATKVEQNPEAIKRNFAVIKDENGFVKRVIEKPRHPVNNLKGCGLYLFDLHIFDAVRRTPRTAMRDEYEITDSIQILINDEFKVKDVPVIEDDINLSYPEDLLSINIRELKRQKKNIIIGENSRVPNQELIKDVVIGDNVTVTDGTVMKNSLVFSNTSVDAAEVIENSILTPETRIYCYNSTRLQE